MYENTKINLARISLSNQKLILLQLNKHLKGDGFDLIMEAFFNACFFYWFIINEKSEITAGFDKKEFAESNNNRIYIDPNNYYKNKKNDFVVQKKSNKEF